MHHYVVRLESTGKIRSVTYEVLRLYESLRLSFSMEEAGLISYNVSALPPLLPLLSTKEVCLLRCIRRLEAIFGVKPA